MAHKNTCVALKNVVIIDFIAYRNSNIEQLNAIQALIAEKNLPVKFVDNMNPYRSHDTLKTNLANGTATTEHLEYYLERELNQDEIQLIDATKKCIEALHVMIKPAIPDYTFAEIPQGSQRILDAIAFRADRIQRNGYTAGHKAMTIIWLAAMGFWKARQHGSDQDRVEVKDINIGGERNKTVIILPDSISIGCQTIPRWEVEQIAIRVGLYKQA